MVRWVLHEVAFMVSIWFVEKEVEMKIMVNVKSCKGGGMRKVVGEFQIIYAWEGMRR